VALRSVNSVITSLGQRGRDLAPDRQPTNDRQPDSAEYRRTFSVEDSS